MAADETPGSLRFSSSRNKLPVGPRVGDTATGNILSRSLIFFPRSEEKKEDKFCIVYVFEEWKIKRVKINSNRCRGA